MPTVGLARSTSTSPNTPMDGTAAGASNPNPWRSTVSATKRNNCSKFLVPPWTRYSNAWVTMPPCTVEADMHSASGTASPPKASSGMPPARHRRTSSSKPSHDLRPPSSLTMTTSTPARSGTDEPSVAGLAARTVGKPSGSDSATTRSPRSSVSAWVSTRITPVPPRSRR